MCFLTLRGREQGEQPSFSHRCFLLPSQTSHEMMMQCVSRLVSHPLHGESCALAGSSLQAGHHPKPCTFRGMVLVILFSYMRLVLGLPSGTNTAEQ